MAQLIPAYIDKPSIPSLKQSPLLAAQMSQIAATTTRTSTSLLAQTIGAGVSAGDSTGTASHIQQQLQIPDYGRTGSRSHSSGKGKGLDPPRDPSNENPGGGGNPGGGRGGGDPHAAGINPPDPNPN